MSLCLGTRIQGRAPNWRRRLMPSCAATEPSASARIQDSWDWVNERVASLARTTSRADIKQQEGQTAGPLGAAEELVH